MSLRIIYGRAGTGKTEYCFSEIAHNIETEKKIYIITPEQFSFTAEKKLMDSIASSAAFNAEVVTFSRMAYRVINEVGGVGLTQLTKSGNAMLVYSILTGEKKSLKFLSKSDENIDLCLNAISEFKKHGITVSQLQSECESQQSSYLQAKLRDLTTIYEAYESQLASKYIDSTDLLSILAEKIDQTAMFKDSIIYIDEFAGFTSQEYAIIHKLLSLAKTVNITVCTDNLTTATNPDTDIFYSNKITGSKLQALVDDPKTIQTVKLETAKRFKTQELEHIEQHLYNTHLHKYEGAPKQLSLFLAKDQYSEIEHIAKNITKQVRDNGQRYRDFAIITQNIDQYSSQIKAIFNKYSIPVFIDEKRTLSQNPVIQYLLTIVDAIAKNWSHDAMWSYIKTGFIGISDDELFKLENYCIQWGIKHAKWTKAFKYGLVDDAHKQEIEHLNSLREQIITPLISLKEAITKQKTAENISKKLYEFLQSQEIEAKLEAKINEMEQNGQIDLASEYKESYKIFISILDEINSIFKDDTMTYDTYINLLKTGFKSSGLGKIPQLADQVTVGDVDRSRSHKVKAIYIIGLNDGAFPSVNSDEGFLNDVDRESLKEDGIELAKGTIDRLYEANFNIYKAFSTAEEELHLSYASTDQEGRALRPSVMIPKIKRLFPKLKETSDIISDVQEILTKETTFEELINNIYGLKSGESMDKIWFDVYKYYQADPEWSAKLSASLKGLNYTNLPEKISQENIDKLYGDTMQTSISKLEQYRKCPFSYYLQYGLKIKEKDQLKIQSINTGTFMHETIDQFFKKIKAEKIELETITDEQIYEIVCAIINEELSQSKNYIFTVTEKYKLLVLRLKRIVTKAIKYIIETLVQSRFEVMGNEVEFGPRGDYKPIILSLENGKQVEIIGKIDRIDVGQGDDGKYLRIIDYKSSSKNIDLNEVYAGLQIQLLTYMDAVCKEESANTAGVLYFSLLEQMIKADKHMNEDEIEAKIKEQFKMKGLILADVKVVKMHDKNLESGASKLVPAYIDKSGALSKKTNGITKEQFADLQKYIDKTIKQISTEILSGQIDLKPYYKKGITPCKYCVYKPICGFNAGFCNNSYNYIGSESKDAILEKIRK